MWLIPTQEDSTPEERWLWFMEHFTPDMEKVLYVEAFRILKSKQDAEDVLQEAIIRSATRCWQLRNEKKLFQWMFTIVRNLAFDKHKDRLESLMCAVQLATGMVYSNVSLEERVMQLQDQERLWREIERLPHPEQDILVLRNTSNMKLIDIAKKLKINYHTTRTKYNRTLAKLERIMRDK